MARLSMWRPNHTNDYNFFDKTISEMFTVGATDILVHKYLGTIDQGASADATQPHYANQSEQNIQDLLFLENRDRKYDTSVYTLRGHYNLNNTDFDLSQFGLFLTADTIFLTTHINDMVERMGRKLIVGDVIEFPHLVDYHPLDEGLPAALKRFYVVNDTSNAAEGFSQTWWPHLWRVKMGPMVDSQEYKDLLNNVPAGDNTTNTLGDLLSTYNKYIGVNDAIVAQAENDVPESGYDTTNIYIMPEKLTDEMAISTVINAGDLRADGNYGNVEYTANVLTPTTKVEGYLTGDALPPNGLPMQTGIAFPLDPSVGDYFLRLDYIPNRLFRYDGKRWIKVEDNLRTSLTPGSSNKSQRSSFVNDNNKTYLNSIVRDVIRAANPYIVPANTSTISFTLSSQHIITTVPYNATYGVETILNGTKIDNTITNSSGNIGFTISNTVTVVANDLVEYSVYNHVVNERQSLSRALKPTADNI